MDSLLSEEEVNKMCKPLTQGAAQKRFIEKVLGIPVIGRRPDGLPLVSRTALEERNSAKADPKSTQRGFNWSK
ncbi:MAG: hypothetical protein RSD57_12435 [Comamonas sp.]